MSQILVIDDSAVTRTCLGKLLERRGYEVNLAPNGKEAWIMLYSGVPDLIVLDLMMPQMDGITFLRMLRHNHHWNEIPVIILTGHSDEEQLLREARSLGVQDVVLKGESSMEQVLMGVRECLGKPAARPAPLHQRRRQLHAV